MRQITPELTPELLKHFKDKNRIASAKAYKVNSYRELVEQTAGLSFLNKDYLLFFRGQKHDHKNRVGSSTFYPTIYRDDYLQVRDLKKKFETLDTYCKALSNHFEEQAIDGWKELKRRKLIQWSILQHYEVCSTPLLDFTQSLRVACSFAMLDSKEKECFIYVFGLPYLTNRISINSEHDLINVRLLSICPPTALRPYFQEGFLSGTEDITYEYDSKSELDFNNRLLAKFIIPNKQSFWSDGFSRIPNKSLYPPSDPIFKLCEEIKKTTLLNLSTGSIGDFMTAWADLEEKILNIAKKDNYRNFSLGEAITSLFRNNFINENQYYEFDRLRKFRNIVVHQPRIIKEQQVSEYIQLLKELKSVLQEIK